MTHTMECPYTEIEILTAKMSVDKKLEALIEERGENYLEIVVKDISLHTEGSINQRAADYHGVNLETLINSPNYALLRRQYQEGAVRLMVEQLKEELGFSDIEAWCLIMVSNIS